MQSGINYHCENINRLSEPMNISSRHHFQRLIPMSKQHPQVKYQQNQKTNNIIPQYFRKQMWTLEAPMYTVLEQNWRL